MTENRRFYYLKHLVSLKSNGVLLLNDYLSHTVQTRNRDYSVEEGETV